MQPASNQPERNTDDENKNSNQMANALGSVALVWGGFLSAVHYIRTENLSGAEGPVGLVIIGGSVLTATYFGNKLPEDPDAAKLAKQIKKNHENGAYF